MVRLSTVRGYQLRDGKGGVGSAVGPFLAGSSLSMKEWGVDPDEEPPRALRIEATLTMLVMLAGYICIGWLVARSW